MKLSARIIKEGKKTGLLMLLLLLSASLWAVEAGARENRVRPEDHIYQLRSLEALYDSRGGLSGHVDREPDINGELARVSELPLFVENDILPFVDSAPVATRIDVLLNDLEKTVDNERAQVIQFNLAYEYFLFYLSFLNQKYLLDFQKESDDVREVAIDQLVSNRELSLYLLQAQLYLQPLIRLPEESGERADGYQFQKDRMLKIAGGTSFIVRDNPGLYLNAVFVSFMIECEKLVGQQFLVPTDETDKVFDAGRPSLQAVRYLDETTWFWLDILWKRYRLEADRASDETLQGGPGRPDGDDQKGGASYIPSAGSLYTLYRTYLTYHFMWRYVADVPADSPFFNTMNRVLFERLNSLQSDAGLGLSIYYRRYLSDSAMDGGQINFMPALFFARRGYVLADLVHEPVDRDVGRTLSPAQMFDLYGELYDRAASKIKNNIPFRSRIYNELVLFGIRLNDLRLMEESLYPYAEKALRIVREDDYTGTEFAESPRLTTVYLLARILENKNSSGLYQGTEQYRDMAEALSPLMIAGDHNNWHYASTIHYALAVFFSRENLRHFNEALAMYHARKAFLAACEKVSLTYGDKWQMFFDLEPQDKAVAGLELFLYFHNKYSTNPEAVIPREFNAGKIIDRWLRRD